MPTSDIQEKTRIAVNTRIAEPPLYKVTYLNDDKTTFDFVLTTLMEIFGYEFDAAISMTERIHNEGKAVVAELSHELAEQKAVEVMSLAKLASYPLQLEVTPCE